MTDTELFMALAAIAGVFVGFGALIGATAGRTEQWLVRNLVNQGLIVIGVALVPVVLGRYGLEDHALWLVASVLALGANWAVILLLHSRREHMAFQVIRTRAQRVVLGVTMLLLEIPAQGALLLVILGPVPDLEPALYLTTVVLWLFQAAVLLVMLVYARGHGSAGPRPVDGPYPAG
jgi:uncharacterized membrane protein